mmetsp:Transcript_28079/g.71166  ORF Transcript_28079/g.71166 Transcript_28079/m.71166 type:complete len:84 (+) Transcript_28079:726-977(+)
MFSSLFTFKIIHTSILRLHFVLLILLHLSSSTSASASFSLCVYFLSSVTYASPLFLSINLNLQDQGRRRKKLAGYSSFSSSRK